MRYEHLRVLLEDEDLWGLFAQLAQSFARAEIPAEIMQPLRLGRMSAFTKPNRRIREIVAGSILRRLICRAVAQQFADIFLETTAPYQYALQTRAGTEALARI